MWSEIVYQIFVENILSFIGNHIPQVLVYMLLLIILSQSSKRKFYHAKLLILLHSNLT